MRYWCAIGTIGTLTPASAATCGVYIPHAATTVSASHRAVIGDDADGPAALDQDVGDPHAGLDAHPERLRAADERVGEPARVEVAVGREPHRAEHAGRVHQREALAAPRSGRAAPSAARTSSPNRAGG